jgi:hypothetical protein
MLCGPERGGAPITYETLVCQEANEVRRKKMVSRFWVHAQSIALGVTDLISISGFTGTPWACPAPNTYRA